MEYSIMGTDDDGRRGVRIIISKRIINFLQTLHQNPVFDWVIIVQMKSTVWYISRAQLYAPIKDAEDKNTKKN